jgi:ABC-type oligopeptide transport system ATPase subunit
MNIDNEYCLKINNLIKHFPVRTGFFNTITSRVKAVDNVSFSIKKNEVLGLVGESGCGKTTLGRTVLRLIEPDSGSILFFGTDILSLNTHELRNIRKRMQIIFQDPYSSLNPRKKIYQIIGEPLIIHTKITKPELKERVAQLLIKTNLEPDMMYKYPHQFSGGQRQRISIARALTMNPDFIVCDEPVSALDVSVQAQILNLLLELKSQFSLTLLFISHDLAVIRQIADNILVMNNGKVVEYAQNDELFCNPKDDYTKLLLKSMPGRKKSF